MQALSLAQEKPQRADVQTPSQGLGSSGLSTLLSYLSTPATPQNEPDLLVLSAAPTPDSLGRGPGASPRRAREPLSPELALMTDRLPCPLPPAVWLQAPLARSPESPLWRIYFSQFLWCRLRLASVPGPVSLWNHGSWHGLSHQASLHHIPQALPVQGAWWTSRCQDLPLFPCSFPREVTLCKHCRLEAL